MMQSMATVIDLIAGLKYQGIDKIGFMTENPN